VAAPDDDADAVQIEVIDLKADAPHEMEAEIHALVLRALPDVPHLKERWYWDSRPHKLVVARVGSVVVGFRFALFRDVVVGHRHRVIVGSGIAVDPAWHRRGVATLLTQHLIDLVKDDANDAIVVFLATDDARPLLRRAGFTTLDVPVQSHDQEGAVVVETAPCLVKELRPGFIAACRADGSLDLGVGSF